MWTTGKDLLKLCLPIWECLGYFHLSCRGKYKSRRSGSLPKMIFVYIVSYHINKSAPGSQMTQKWHRLQPLRMRGRQGRIRAPSESLRTDSWLGWYPVETVLSSPLTWQEPSGQKSLFLVLFQREHIGENTIKVPPTATTNTPTDTTTMEPLVVSFIVFVFVPKAYYTLISPKLVRPCGGKHAGIQEEAL